MNSNFCLIQTTCPDLEAANNLARACVENKLVACVNILPAIQSIYRWEGNIEQQSESLLIMKTMHLKRQALEAFISQHHPYDMPEFICINIESGSTPYLDWIMQSLQ